jgi:adenylosuccinate lyase
VTPNKEFINKELNNNWEVLTEAVQTVMRYEGIDNAYEQLKDLSRGQKLDKKTYIDFINNLQISHESKKKLIKLTPAKYIGLAKSL